MRVVIACAVVVAGLAATAEAQQVIVQQPAVQSFSAQTTVSVPDRGSISIGGLSRGATVRRTPGGARSSAFDGSSVTAHVWIQDLRAMDEALLQQTAPPAVPSSPKAAEQDRWVQRVERLWDTPQRHWSSSSRRDIRWAPSQSPSSASSRIPNR